MNNFFDELSLMLWNTFKVSRDYRKDYMWDKILHLSTNFSQIDKFVQENLHNLHKTDITTSLIYISWWYIKIKAHNWIYVR